MGIVLWNASDLLERARDVLKYSSSAHDYSTPLPPSRGDPGSKAKSGRGSIARSLMRKIPLAPDEWLMIKETTGRQEVRGLVTEDHRENLVYK